MPSLVRQSRTFYVDAEGKRVKKGSPGAKKKTEKDPRWYGQGIPGLPAKKRVPLASDKTAAQRILDNMVRDAEQGRAYLPDREAARKPLKDHLAEFEKDLALGLASVKGKRRRTPDPRQVRLVAQRVRDLLSGCKFASVADLNDEAPAKLARHLHDRVKLPRTKEDGGISSQTADFILAAGRRFARWMAKRAAVRADLFDGIPGFDPNNDRKHARRDVSAVELAKVLEAAKSSKRTVRNLTGPDRYHLYLSAFATGFRASELAALRPDHFFLNANPPAVSLPGKKTKNKKGVRFPLAPAVAIQLRSYLADKPADQPIWPGKWRLHAAKMLRVDLAAAGVPYQVEGVNGPEFSDFHALRHTFCSALAASGTGPKELQTLARHSDPRLTLGLYTHARSEELVKAVGRLQVPGSAPESPLAGLSREELERVTLGLLLILGTVLSPGAGQEDVSLRTPLRTPVVGILGDTKGRSDTVTRIAKRKRV